MKDLQKYMNVNFGMRLGAFVLCTILFYVVVGVLSWFIFNGGMTTVKLRMATVLQDLILFIVPAVITAMIANRLPARFLLLNNPTSIIPYFYVLMVLIFSIPAMNFVVELNASMQLPASMADVEDWLRKYEEGAAESVNMLLGGTSVGNLIINILIVGVLAGFSEELFFRGGLQQIFITAPMNPHVAIWVTAFIFSAFHMQFFGFVPRLLMGAYFGYLAWWSRTIWLPAVAHILNNTVVVVASWVVANGNTAQDINHFGVDYMPTVLASVVLTAGAIFLLARYLKRGKNGIKEAIK